MRPRISMASVRIGGVPASHAEAQYGLAAIHRRPVAPKAYLPGRVGRWRAWAAGC